MEIQRRFAMIAIEKGYITKEQIIEALTTQITQELEKKKQQRIGTILLSKGYMTQEQIDEVAKSLSGQIE